MTTSKGLLEIISKQTHNRKSGYCTYAKCKDKIEIHSEMHTLTSFYVCATNDVSTFHVPYLPSFYPF